VVVDAGQGYKRVNLARYELMRLLRFATARSLGARAGLYPYSSTFALSAHRRADGCGRLYCQSMADNRTELDKHLGITEQNYAGLPYARYRALMDHVGQALNSQNYAAAQAYATLLVAEAQESSDTIDVRLTNWEDLAIGIGSNISSS
jgi:hypothetical protein